MTLADFEPHLEAKPFAIPNRFGGRMRRVVDWASPTLERALKLDFLNWVYDSVTSRSAEQHFSDRCLDVLGINYKFSEELLAPIPRTGPLVVAANHPFGAIDGIILNSLLRRVRSDVKLLGTTTLSRMPAYAPDFCRQGSGREKRRLDEGCHAMGARRRCAGRFPIRRSFASDAEEAAGFRSGMDPRHRPTDPKHERCCAADLF
jgi:hypothetical protein